MTQPKLATTTQNGRTYRDPLKPDSNPLDSVTSVLSAGIPKHLDNWHCKIVAETAKQHPDAEVDWLKGASKRYAAEAAQRGDLVHESLEHWAETGQLRQPTFADGQAGIDAAPYVEQLAAFLDAWPIEVVWSEVTVFSHTHGYAGTFDLLANVPGHGLLLIDLKTGERVYAEVGLQLAALRYADYAVIYDGDTPRAVELPEVDGCAVIHIIEESHALVPVQAGPEEHEQFLVALKTTTWARGAERRIVGQKLEPAPAIKIDTKPPRVTELEKTVIRLIDNGLGDDLVQAWPADLPMLSQPSIASGVLDAIEHFLGRFWAEHEDKVSFDESDIDPWLAVRKGKADELTARLKKLPADLLAAVEAGCSKAEVGPLRNATEAGYDYTVDLVTKAELEAAERHSRLVTEVLDAIDDGDTTELLPAVLIAAIGKVKPLSQLMELEGEAVSAVLTAYKQGFAVFVYGDDGVTLEAIATAVDLLVDAFGSKSSAVAASKPPAKRHRANPPRSINDLASSVVLTGLTLKTTATTT